MPLLVIPVAFVTLMKVALSGYRQIL